MTACLCEWRGWLRAGANADCPIHGVSATSAPLPAPLTTLQIRDALDETARHIEDACELVGQYVPSSAKIWAEARGIKVTETRFAPPNRLYLIGAVPVPDVFIP